MQVMVDGRVQAWLEHFLDRQKAVAGTVHSYFRSEEKTGLKLVAAVNIPAKVQEIVAWVPAGKGMAGEALVQGVPVQTCNLKDDSSGAVRPGAKAVDAQAAVALPVRSASGEISAVVGIAYGHEHVFDPQELARLQEAAASVVTEL
jgi:L-methionine (R)-S-oxide reductase